MYKFTMSFCENALVLAYLRRRKRKREEQKKQKGQKKLRKGHAVALICMLFLCACTSEGRGG